MFFENVIYDHLYELISFSNRAHVFFFCCSLSFTEKINKKEQKCRVSFEDNSRFWVAISDLHGGMYPDSHAEICGKIPNDISICA